MSKINRSWYTSANDEWYTPPDLFAVLDAEFSFGRDVCAAPGCELCPLFWSPADDGLAQFWPPYAVAGAMWLNPPYSAVRAWMRKAHTAALCGSLVVCLVPARTDTRWFWDYARAGEVRLLPGRLRFGGPGAVAGAPFPSAVVILRPGLPAGSCWFWDYRRETPRLKGDKVCYAN